MRYIRNSLCEEDYNFTLRLFYQRLWRNLISYKEGLQRMESTRTKKNLTGLFVYPLSYDEVGCV